MMVKPFLYLILLSGFATVTAAASYIIQPSQSVQSWEDCVECDGMDIDDLTLPQFVNSLSNYLTDNTILIFSPGNYSLESEFLVENIHSFSMFVWSDSSSKAVITCGHSAKFEFRNVSAVTVSGLEFMECFENHVISVSRFQLKNSGFFGSGQPIVNGTVLSIEESTANLDRIVFKILSAMDELGLQYNCDRYCMVLFSAIDGVIGIAIRGSNVSIIDSQFEGNNVGIIGAVIVIFDGFGSKMVIINSTFVNNSARVLYRYDECSCYCDCNVNSGIVQINGHGSRLSVNIYDSKFVQNEGVILFGENFNMHITNTRFTNNMHSRGCVGIVCVADSNVIVNHSTFNNNIGLVLKAIRKEVSISHSEFLCNNGSFSAHIMNFDGAIITIDHSKLVNNTGYSVLSVANTDMITLKFNEFINNNIPTGLAVVYMPYYTTADLKNNVFTNNSAKYDIFISSVCGSNFSLSLGNSRCIPCSDYWLQDLIGIVAAAFIAGIVLVIFILALNLTVAVGSLNGILFYANIVAINIETYFSPSTAPNFVTVFISWLNLDIGFDICFIKSENSNTVVDLDELYKVLLQLAFPLYVIFLVIIMIVASERSSKFAKIIGKGNPVAVLATMILLSLAKFINAIIVSFSLTYYKPAYGSRNVDVTKIEEYNLRYVDKLESTDIVAATYSVLAIDILFFSLCTIYVALVFFWQWLLQYQNKVIFKWVRYQKLRHFIEPYHAPYTAEYRYWTGLLLFIRIFLYFVSVLNFSLNPRVDLLVTIFIIGGLILLKGVTANRVYKNWPIDVMETAIYFNLVAFSALTWYNLDFGGNQIAVAYTSVMIIFILLLGVIVFHVLCYTKIYKCSFVKKAFEWTSSKILEKKPKERPLNDAPEELDGYRLERTGPGDQEQPTMTYSVVEIN